MPGTKASGLKGQLTALELSYIFQNKCKGPVEVFFSRGSELKETRGTLSSKSEVETEALYTAGLS